MNTLTLARTRAIIGVGFAALGIAIAVRSLLQPGPLGAKGMGLAFSAVMIALGAVRLRGYWLMRRAVP